VFPYSEFLKDKDQTFYYKDVLQNIWPLLTTDRQNKISTVVAKRNFNCSVLLENIYDRGNMSAVIRSAEAFGLTLFNSVEPNNKVKQSQRTTAGADKWIELARWKNTSECISAIKNQGRKIYVTHLSPDSKSIYDIDWSTPCTIAFGNEKEGASKELIQAADDCVIIPMKGFVQSFNISVAAALCFQVISQGSAGIFLDSKEQDILKAYYATKTLDSSFDVLRNYYEKNK
jgi:tRNA (guanosine-2'-O-)-methyltransferase